MASVISVLAKLKADTGSYVSGMKVAQKSTENFQRVASQGAKNTEKATSESFGKMGQTALKLGSIVKAAVIGFVTIQGAQFLQGAIKQASGFEAEFEGVNQVFGDGAKVVQDFAKNAAVTAGLAETTALRFAKSFGGYASSAGLAGDEMAKFSTTMVQAAGDLGSFYDLPTESALMAIQQGLRGEYEPLRRFNILLDENKIGQKAMQMGLSSTGKNLTQQQKILARQKLIMEGLGVAQGDFVKYADTYGNSIKTTSALFQNLQKDVGGALLPAMAKLSQAVVPLIATLGPLLTDAIAALTPVIDAVTLAMGSLEPVLKPIMELIKILAGTFATLVAQVLPPLLQILAPILNLFVALIKPLADLITAILPAFNTILTAIATALQGLIPVVQPIIVILSQMGKVIADAFNKAAPYIALVVQQFGLLLTQVIPLIEPIYRMALDLLPSLMDAFIGLLPSIMSIIAVIITLVKALAPLIPPILMIVASLLPPLINLFNALAPVILKIVEAFTAYLIPVLVAVVSFLTPVIKGIADFINFVVQKIADFINWLMPFIMPVLNAIIDGVNAVLTFLGMQPIPKLSPSAKKDAFKQGKEIGEAKVAGETSVTGQAAGVAAAGPAVPPPAPKGKGAKNPVVEFYKKMADEIAQQRAKVKLIQMGLNEDLANQVVSAGEGWKKIYNSIKSGGTKAIKDLESKFAQTAAGLARIADSVKESMDNVYKSITEGFDITKFGQSATQVLGNARRMVERAKAFGAEIVNLAKMNLSPVLLNQLIAAGPQEGYALAKSLSTAGMPTINELNSLYGQTLDIGAATAGQYGNTQTNFYIDVSGGLGDKNSIGKAIVEAIKGYERQNGKVFST